MQPGMEQLQAIVRIARRDMAALAGDTSRDGNLCALRRVEAVSGYSDGSEEARLAFADHPRSDTICSSRRKER
jgi:hypothetical protein